MGPYAEFGERLIERGYAAIPIMPGTKKPGFYFAGMWIGLSNWTRRFNSGPPPESERLRWSAGDTGLGVLGGYRGLIAVDIDTEIPALRKAVMSVLPPSPIRKSGQKGETLFYYGPDITKSQSWDIDKRRVVDLIGPGRQTVLPPTIHPDTGQPYRWCGLEALDDLEPEDLPELPADIAEQITAVLLPFGWRPEPPPHINGSDDGETPHRQLNDAAMASLAAWVPALNLYRCRPARGGYEAVPIWRPSTSGRPTDKRHLNLKISPQGIRDFGADTGYTPLDLVMAADGCDLDTAFRFLSERLGWGTDIDLSALVRQADTKTAIAEPTADAEPQAKPEAESPAAGELDRYTTVPGAVGEIIDWITATARRPNRVLALGAAVTIVGTLIGRRVAGPTQSATHLYVVQIAPTGAGKQHIINAAGRLMAAAKAEPHIGPGKFFSGSAVERLLQDKPLSLGLLDEIGAFLQSVTNRKASSHEKAVSQMLRTLWGCSFARVALAQRATEEAKAVNCPALSILGMSTPDEFHAALQGDSVANGFLNRFLVLATEARPVDTNPLLDPFMVPASLADALHRLYVWNGPEGLLQINEPTATFVPDVLPWASTQASDCYADLTHTIEQYTDDNPDSAYYLARAGETAVRLATIRAAGRWGRGATVDLADMEWGAGIAWIAGQALAAKAQEFLPANERSEMADKVVKLIRRRGATKPRDVQRFFRSRLRSHDVKDILGQLVEAGEIEWTADGYKPL